MSLTAFQTGAARLTQRISESISESTRDLQLSSGGLGGLSFDVADQGTLEDRAAQIKKQLDSSSDREKLDALKKLLASLSKSTHQIYQQSTFFPLVVKNVASNSLEVRKLVYIYLLRFAHLEPDLALLSINTFQKDLADANPLIRAMALRVLSGIGRKVSMIQPLVQLSVRKCAGDPSPYVRKAAAFALIKCFEAEPMPSTHLETLIALLADSSPLSLGGAALAALTIAPTSFFLLHKHYRRYCQILPDIDAWGQCYMAQLLAIYARANLRQPQPDSTLDSDLKLLLTSMKPMLLSQNPATILTAVRITHYLSPSNQTQQESNQALIVLLSNGSTAVKRIVLGYIDVLTRTDTEFWTTHHNYFIIRERDHRIVKSLKLRILQRLQTNENARFLEREYAHYVHDRDPAIVDSAVRALGISALRGTGENSDAEKLLLSLVDNEDGDDLKSTTAITVLLSLITRLSSQEAENTSSNRSKARRIVGKLARTYMHEKLGDAKARGSVLWIAGTFAGKHDSDGEVEDWAPDLVRIAAKRFKSESQPVRLHSLTCAAKVSVCASEQSKYFAPIKELTRYIMSLGQQDADLFVRDRTRFLYALLSRADVIEKLEVQTIDSSNWANDFQDNEEEGEYGMTGGVTLRRAQVKAILLGGKREIPLVVEEEPYFPGAPFGSLSSVLDRDMRFSPSFGGVDDSLQGDGDGLSADAGLSDRLPEWTDTPTDASVREVALPPKPAPPPVTSLGSGPVAGMKSPSGVPHRFLSSSAAGMGIPNASGSGANTPIVGQPSPAGSVGMKGDWTDLDKFYASSSEESEEESEEEEEEEEEEEKEGEEREEEGSGAEVSESGEEETTSASEEGEGAALLAGPSRTAAVPDEGEVATRMKALEDDFYD